MGKHRVSDLDREIGNHLLELGAINFEAVGSTIAKFGPASAFEDDGWIRWCGSDMRIFRWPRPWGLEELETLRDAITQVGMQR